MGCGLLEAALGEQDAGKRAMGGLAARLQGDGAAGPVFGGGQIPAQHMRVRPIKPRGRGSRLDVGGAIKAVGRVRRPAIQGVELGQAKVDVTQFRRQFDRAAESRDGVFVQVSMVVRGAEIAVGGSRVRTERHGAAEQFGGMIEAPALHQRRAQGQMRIEMPRVSLNGRDQACDRLRRLARLQRLHTQEKLLLARERCHGARHFRLRGNRAAAAFIFFAAAAGARGIPLRLQPPWLLLAGCIAILCSIAGRQHEGRRPIGEGQGGGLCGCLCAGAKGKAGWNEAIPPRPPSFLSGRGRHSCLRRGFYARRAWPS